MAFIFDNNKGRTIAKIEGGTMNNKVVSIIDDDEKKGAFKELKLESGKFQQIPNPKTERSCLYITGASGSGKSTYISRYAREYKKMFKQNPIFIFSALNEDKTLDVLKPSRFKIDHSSLIDDPIKVEDLHDSLVIFDDIDCINNKELKDATYHILNACLQVGRHHNISVALLNHLPTSGVWTRIILNECHNIVFFPSSGNTSKLKKLLIDVIGIDKKDFDYAKKSKSRWATVFKNYPMCIMTETNIKMLDTD